MPGAMNMNSLNPNAYEQYRKAVLAIPRLPRESARELAWLAWKGDRDARRELVERHLWMVVDAAERLRPWQAQAFESLISVGNVSLVRAAESYCPWDRREFEEFAWDSLLIGLSREAIPTA
jgi:DNA-directed RNA polymerase sigma subunit (sigma70/sigma32)